jgi:hypothetical protein
MRREDRAPHFGLILNCLQGERRINSYGVNHNNELLSDKDSHLVAHLWKYLLSNNTVSHLAGCNSHLDSRSV